VVSEKIAMHSKSFGEGEFIKFIKVWWMLQVQYVLKRKNYFENICLSRRTVVRRIEMMAADIKKV
jgi:hypothetical protein